MPCRIVFGSHDKSLAMYSTPHAAMPQLRRLDRGIPPPVLLGQPTIQTLHFGFDVRRIGLHARLP